MKPKKSSQLNKKIEATFRKVVHKADKAGIAKSFKAPKHLATGQRPGLIGVIKNIEKTFPPNHSFTREIPNVVVSKVDLITKALPLGDRVIFATDYASKVSEVPTIDIQAPDGDVAANIMAVVNLHMAINGSNKSLWQTILTATELLRHNKTNMPLANCIRELVEIRIRLGKVSKNLIDINQKCWIKCTAHKSKSKKTTVTYTEVTERVRTV